MVIIAELGLKKYPKYTSNTPKNLIFFLQKSTYLIDNQQEMTHTL